MVTRNSENKFNSFNHKFKNEFLNFNNNYNNYKNGIGSVRLKINFFIEWY